MTRVVLTGADPDGLGDALEAEGATVVRVTDLASAASLGEAGIEASDLLVLTDMDDATAIAVAKELNPDVRVVTYAHDSLPEFARAQADLAVDPALLGPDVVAEELLRD